ncbi:MAG: NRDE family protein [Vicingaceae bacterium]
MCTLTYIPKSDEFLLTSNRDEAKSRKVAHFPVYKEINEQKVLFPQDGDALGSWIATSKNRLVNLLNGAWENYQHQPPYRKSRGIVLLESYEFDELEDFALNYNFDNIAPFTLVGLDFKNNLKMEVLRWDEKSMAYEELDAEKPHIFSSAPLYPKSIQHEREKLFADFLKEKDEITATDMINFHQFGGSENAPIKLDESHFVHTLSITSVEKKKNEVKMQYHDLIQNEVMQQTVS